MSAAFDADKMMNWLRKRLPNARCPMCETPFFSGSEGSNVSVHKTMVVMPQIEKKGDKMEMSTSRGKASLYFTCESCGYAMLFDTVKLGLS